MSSKIIEKSILNIGWVFIIIFSIFLFVITSLYFVYYDDTEYNFLAKKQEVVHDLLWRTAFYIHITGGMLAIITGPFQFVKKLRNKFLNFHRFLGKIYIVSILILAAPSGLLMAFYAEGGTIAVIGFFVMAVLWMITTYKAYQTIKKKDIFGHQKWMYRSFALTFAAVTLRLYVPFASAILGISDFIVEASSAWVSWLPNLVMAEILLLKTVKRV